MGVQPSFTSCEIKPCPRSSGMPILHQTSSPLLPYVAKSHESCGGRRSVGAICGSHCRMPCICIAKAICFGAKRVVDMWHATLEVDHSLYGVRACHSRRVVVLRPNGSSVLYPQSRSIRHHGTIRSFVLIVRD